MSAADGIKHGTRSGYQKHKRLRVPACEDCHEANRVYQERYRKTPGVKSAERERNRIREAALWRLADRHRDEYHAIVDALTADPAAVHECEPVGAR